VFVIITVFRLRNVDLLNAAYANHPNFQRTFLILFMSFLIPFQVKMVTIYKKLEELLGSNTDESHRPSLQKKAKRTKTLPFTASLQHVKNVDPMLQCDECSMWRLLSVFMLQTNQKGAN